MHIKFIDNLTLDIYIKKIFLSNTDFKNKDSIENYLKRLFKILKEKYNIIIEGYYDINIYLDEHYGALLHLEKEDIDYYDFYKNQVDMKIKIQNCEFLYLVDDIPDILFNKVDIINKDNKIYLKIKKDITELDMMKLMEYSEVTH